MVSLTNISEKFHILFQVIEGGHGWIRGTLSETDQNSQPAYVFVPPRHVFRTEYPTPLRPGMVIRSATGAVFIVGENGPSEGRRGVLWQSFRLFEATGQYVVTRKTRVRDRTTGVERDGEPIPIGTVWAALEPLDRPVSDREMRIQFDQRRVITGAPLKEGDILDNHTITKVDKMLGLSIGVLM